MHSTHARVGSACALTVVLALGACSGPGITSVTIDGGDRTIAVGDSFTLSVTVVSSSGASDAVAWQSSDEAVAVVDVGGTVTGLAVGVADVTATSTVDPGRSDTVTVTVDPPGVVAWTRQFGTATADVAHGVATDAEGSVYAVGRTGGALEGTPTGGTDAFVRSYDGAGVLRWTRQFGTGSFDLAYGVATDASGNLYVVGRTFGAFESTSAGGLDAYVRSYDGAGALRWTRQFGTSGDDEAFGVATDANGNVYVVGRTGGDLDGPNAGGTDAFVRSYDGDGTLRWTRQFGTSSNEFARGVATDASGNVYVAGSTGGALEGAGSGSTDAFVRSFDGDGGLRWTRQFGTGSPDVAAAVATDASGNVYVAGSTGGALEGAGSGSTDAFVRSFDGAGTIRWTRQFGTSSDDDASGVAADANGNVYAVGVTLGALEGASAGGADAFVRSFASNGALRWTRQFGASSYDIASDVATDASGGVYVTGTTEGALDGANAGGEDAYVRKYGW